MTRHMDGLLEQSSGYSIVGYLREVRDSGILTERCKRDDTGHIGCVFRYVALGWVTVIQVTDTSPRYSLHCTALHWSDGGVVSVNVCSSITSIYIAMYSGSSRTQSALLVI